MNYSEAVQLVIEGEESGFDALYKMTYQSKFYLALKYMQDVEAAKDVLQDAYIKAFSRLDTLTEPEKFSSWLGMIVANTAKNALKKQNPILFSDITTDSEEVYEYQIEDENIQNQPEIAYSQKEVQELVRELIDSLPEEQRMCILMFHIEEQSIHEIAEALGCSENTVKSRLNYGRKSIKKKAEELQKKGYKLFSIVLLVPLLRSEENALAAQKTFPELGNAMEDYIMNSISMAKRPVVKPQKENMNMTKTQPKGQALSSEVLKQGFLHTTVGKMVAVGIGICTIVAGIVGLTQLEKNNSSDTSTDKVVNVETVEEAVRTEIPETLIPSQTPVVENPATPKPNLFAKLPKKFTFSSGAGAWGTTLNLKSDGSFTGEYSDSDLGDTGKKYPKGTVYICKFKGKFSVPKKVNKYTYSSKLESLQQEGKEDDVYYKKGKRYIVSGPYGLEDAKEFRIYLPNAPISKVPDEFLSWAFWQEPEGKKLGLYGLYNVAGKEGFTAYKE